jgi:endonuclease/exonuclease/phosphatase family metal-dependent hydrolase
MSLLFRQLFFCAFCLTLWLSASGEALRIATYNINNYLVMDRHVGGGWRPAYPKAESEKSVIRRIVTEVEPDILALQEMGATPFLEELRADLALEGIHYPYAIHLEGSDGVRHIALLSNMPPAEVVKHYDLDFKYFDRREVVKRGMLEVSFVQADGSKFKLFVIHLKSRWSDEPDDPDSNLRRTREAEACRNRIIERTLELGVADYLIAGDFNDHPASAPLRRFTSRGDLMIGASVPAADSRGEVWTYFYAKQAEYSRVDGFIVSSALEPRIQGGSGAIVDSPGALDGSDHRMVYIDLNFPVIE